jgi:hypothetical protein
VRRRCGGRILPARVMADQFRVRVHLPFFACRQLRPAMRRGGLELHRIKIFSVDSPGHPVCIVKSVVVMLKGIANQSSFEVKTIDMENHIYSTSMSTGRNTDFTLAADIRICSLAHLSFYLYFFQ